MIELAVQPTDELKTKIADLEAQLAKSNKDLKMTNELVEKQRSMLQLKDLDNVKLRAERDAYAEVIDKLADKLADA